MRYLAIDLGDKRTGLAMGDDGTGIVSALTVIEQPRGPALLAALEAAVAEHGPDELVLGLPLNMDDTEGDRARLTRTFGADLATRCGLPVRYQDERLTSEAANARLARTGRTHGQKKAIRDALAAAEILEDYLRSLGA